MAAMIDEFRSQMDAAIDEAKDKFIRSCARSIRTLQE